MAKKPATPRQFLTSPAIRELARLARKLRRIESAAELLHNGTRITLTLATENDGLESIFLVRTSMHAPGEGIFADAKTIQMEMQRMVDQWLHAQLFPDTVQVRTSAASDLSPEGMRDLLRRVWCEACGVNPDVPAPLAPARKSVRKLGAEEFDSFMKVVSACADEGKLKRAMEMLKAESFQLYAEINDHDLVGVVRSQTKDELVYSCHLTAHGRYGCCTPDLHECWGMRKELCKHLLVLIVGLAKSGEISTETMTTWITAAARKKPSLHQELLSETLLKYKGAEAGEIDWRPTETIPEDYFAY